jgi:hypothetical protein
MKTRRILRNTVMVLLTGLTVVSCNDNEEPLDVITDVYVINKMFDNEVKSAATYIAYANKELLSVSVVFPNSAGNIALESYPGSIYTMAKEPKDADYKTTAPVNGSYSFTIQSADGETLQVPDILSYEGLDIPEFTKITFSGTPFILDLEWNDVTDADGYVVKMFDTDGKLIFNGYSVGADVNKYTVNGTSNSGFWSTPAVNGESYVLQLNAFSYDAEANASNYVYNLSEISLAETQIEWGVN